MILGLDIGQKRVGVAIADEGMRVATPHLIVPVKDRKQLLERIQEVVEEFGAKKIVVGLPKTLKDEIGVSAKQVMALVDWMKEKIAVDWVFWDERLSTKEVERILLEADLNSRKRRHIQDSLAAQRILQGYLDHHFHRNASAQI